MVDLRTTREIAISKFRASCLRVLEEVTRTGTPVIVTRFGKPIAEIIPPRTRQKTSWLGCMKDSMDVIGDIEGPVGAFTLLG